MISSLVGTSAYIWESLHRNSTILPESFVEIEYWITEAGAQELASESNNGALFYSKHSEILETGYKYFQKFATLENNLWLLDGGCSILPNENPNGSTGYIADAEYPMVTITFPSVRTQPVPGITVVWSDAYEEYATRCRVTALNGTVVVASDEFYNDSVQSTFELPIENYDRIYIEILDWLIPDHRPRIERVYLGAREIYTKSDLVKYSHTQTADLLSTELPKNEIVFSLDNSSDVWNPNNPTGNVKYLTNRQEVSVYYGYKINGNVQMVPAGTFWLSGWDTPTNGLEATFTARDLLEFLDIPYTGPRSGTLYDIALAALTQANLPLSTLGGPRYSIDSSLREITTDFTDDDTQYTAAVILQMVANAGQCVMRQTWDGLLRIKKLDKRPSGYVIGQNVSYTHPEQVMTKPPQSVNINDGLWVENVGSSGETISLSNPLISQVGNAADVGQWVGEVLQNRSHLRGTFRPDPRLEVLDIVSIESKYSDDLVAAITEITYEYNGAFRGQYTARQIEV